MEFKAKQLFCPLLSTSGFSADDTEPWLLFLSAVYITTHLAGVVREMEAVKAVADAWPARREACIAQATAASGSADSSAPNAAGPVAGPVVSSSTAVGGGGGVAAVGVDDSGPAATLAWLSSFNMEGKVLQQLISLKPRITAATGSGIFSGDQSMTRCGPQETASLT